MPPFKHFNKPIKKSAIQIIEGDCLEVMPSLLPDSFDSVVSDPPYGLSFIGKSWDRGVPGVPFWNEAKRVLKPGAYMLVMGGSRTYHRLACTVEDAGFEIRDCLMWIYGSGFPKAKSCLKPAYEPILLCRKPGKGVRELGIGECRILSADRTGELAEDRWPANVLHDGSEEVMDAFAAGKRKVYDTTSTAARFFYCAKANKSEREAGLDGLPERERRTLGRGLTGVSGDRSGKGGKQLPLPMGESKVRNHHPTVKPLALMEWLVKLVTPPNGLTLDPFAGSGTTGKAAVNTGRRAVLIEREAAYLEIARSRCKGV